MKKCKPPLKLQSSWIEDKNEKQEFHYVAESNKISKIIMKNFKNSLMTFIISQKDKSVSSFQGTKDGITLYLYVNASEEFM